MIRVVAVVVALSACGRGSAPPPARDALLSSPIAISVEVEVDGEAQPAVAVTDRLVLWSLCDDHAAAWIDLRGPNGSFVHGECAHRDAYELVIRRDGERLAGELRARDGVVAASVADVLGVELVSKAALASVPTLPPLRVSIDDAAPIELPPDQWLGEGQGGGRHRGTDLASIVELAGVPVGEVASVVIRGPGGDYTVEPAWLPEIFVRYNNRGELRIRHVRRRTEIARRNAPTVIEIRR